MSLRALLPGRFSRPFFALISALFSALFSAPFPATFGALSRGRGGSPKSCGKARPMAGLMRCLPFCLPVFAALPLLAAARPAEAVECRNETWEANRYSVCEVDAAQEDLRLFLYDPGGAPYGDFEALKARLAGQGKTLAFAMNAGMYHENRAPVGQYVEEGEELMHLVPNAGPGNFGLLPNGVLCIAGGRADVIETLRFEKSGQSCRFATQSGPMLVIDGKLHPRFLPDSTSRYVRNGVGTSADGSRVVFVISRNAVTFWEFASFFRDGLHLPQALYLDGNVSRLYAPELGRDDWGRQMGPIVAVVAPEPGAEQAAEQDEASAGAD